MSFLEDIVKEKKTFIQKRKDVIPKAKLIDKLAFPLREPEFKNRLYEPGTHLIAEIKRASPSKGDLRPDCDVSKIAQTYESSGVRFVSILTEEKFFKGNIEELEKVKTCTTLSVLRKDFIIDEYQILEATAHGADALLLIVSILDKDSLNKLCEKSKKLHLDVVVEVHTESELKTALEVGAEIIGINNRNLDDFSIDLKTAERLIPQIPKDKLIIVESGIETVEDAKNFKNLGVSGILVGEALMKSDNIENTVKQFLGALL